MGQTIVREQARPQRAVEDQSRDAFGAEFPQKQSKDRTSCEDGKNKLEEIWHEGSFRPVLVVPADLMESEFKDTDLIPFRIPDANKEDKISCHPKIDCPDQSR